MHARDEKRAAGLLLVLGTLGLLARILAAPSAAPGEIGFNPAADPDPAPHARPRLDSVRALATRLARPLAPGERIDVDRAPALELTRLPRIGTALATRIVAYRDENGPFGSLEALVEVPGIGPGLTESVRPHVQFSSRRMRPRSQRRSAESISINSAGEEELRSLPGIGPARARAILEYRRTHGNFSNINELENIPGIGPATVARVRERVRIP